MSVSASHPPPEPLFTSSGSTVTLPLASRKTVMFWQTAINPPAVSSTVTVAVHVDVLPDSSVTVSTTTLGPRSSQSKVAGVTSSVTGPQLSDEPSSTCEAVIVTIVPTN